MTVKEIKSETQERFTVYRYKAMPPYCALFFLIVNVAVVTALLCALVSTLPWYVSAILWWYGCLLMLAILVFAGPFSYSCADYFVRAYNAKNTEASFDFAGFNKFNFARTSAMFLLRFLLIFVLTCLLIVPGIVFAVKTCMAYQLMRANPKLTAVKAMKASSKVMKGHGLLYFRLIMSFVGWFLLCLLTLGAGFIYIMPYFNACKAVFYKRELQGDKAEYASARQSADIDNKDVSALPVKEEPSVTAEQVSVEETGAQEPETIAVQAQTVEASEAESEPVVEVVEPIVTVVEQAEAGSTEKDEVIVIAPQPEPIIKVEKENTDPVSHIEEEKTDDTVIPAEESEAEKHRAEEELRMAAAKEEIKQRIERLKRERSRNSARPEPARHKVSQREEQSHEAADPRAKTNVSAHAVRDEFAPEKIDIEIVEED